MDNCVICGKPGVMFRESGYVCEYHGSMCDRGYDLADIVDEENQDIEIVAIQEFEKSIGFGISEEDIVPLKPLTERDYLALSAVVDSERGLLPFSNAGDIPEDVFMTLRKANLISARLGGYKALEAGRLALKAYRQPTAEAPNPEYARIMRERLEAASATAADVRSLPQRYRDERTEARERGETIKDYTGWLEHQVELGEFYQQVQAERGNDFEAETDDLRAKLASVAEIANDYRDQIWVHQGTLRVIKSWLSKADGFSAEDGFTEASILGMVERDLEASEKMDTRTLVDSEQATG